MLERARSEERFRQLAERSPDFICILDVDPRFRTYANRESLLGHQVADLRDAQLFLELTHPDDQQDSTTIGSAWPTATQESGSMSFAR